MADDLSTDSAPDSPSVGGDKASLTKGPWTQSEDALLLGLVTKFGPREWSAVSTAMTEHGHHRLGKQCRERYVKNDAKQFCAGQLSHDSAPANATWLLYCAGVHLFPSYEMTSLDVWGTWRCGKERIRGSGEKRPCLLNGQHRRVWAGCVPPFCISSMLHSPSTCIS